MINPLHRLMISGGDGRWHRGGYTLSTRTYYGAGALEPPSTTLHQIAPKIPEIEDEPKQYGLLPHD